MRAVLSGVALLLGSGLASACSDDATAGAGLAPPPPHPAKAEPPTPPPRPAYATPEQRGEIVGHVRLADPAALLAKLEALVPPSLAESLAPDALRKRLSRGESPTTAALLGNIDFGPAAGCVLLDAVAREQPFACIFGYRGGLAQLRADLGPDGVIEDGAAALHVERDGAQWFFDELGERIVFGFDADAYEVSRAYLGVLANPGGTRDVEVVLHTAHAAKAYRKEVSSLIIAASVAAQGHSGIAVLDDVRESLAGLGPEVTELALDTVDELAGLAAQAERVELFATVAPERLAFGARVVPSVGSALSRWFGDSPALEPELWQWLPNGTWMTWASRRHAGGTLRPRWDALQWRVVAHYLARFAERDLASLDAAADELDEARRKSYGDWTLFAAFNSPATRGGAVLVRPKNVGIDARQTWLDFAEAATPRAVFGDALGRTVEGTVRWSVVPAATTVEGLTVDEWRLSAAPGLLARLDRSLSDGGVGKEIIAALQRSETLLAVQRFELDGAVAFTLAPGGGVSYARKIIRAKQGQGRLPSTGVETVLRGRGSTQRLAALSAFDLLRGIREMLPRELRADLPEPRGQDLSDLHYTESVGADGSRTHELTISTFALEAVRDALRLIRSVGEPSGEAP